jgi:hypothetical protein
MGTENPSHLSVKLLTAVDHILTAASSLTCVGTIAYSYVTARCQEQQLRGSRYRCKVGDTGKQVDTEIDSVPITVTQIFTPGEIHFL